MIAAHYRFKKDLKAAIGQELNYTETSIFGAEFKPDGSFVVVGPSAANRKWFAQVTMEKGKIKEVE